MIIFKVVNIEKGSVIAAVSVVTKNVAVGAITAEVPAKQNEAHLGIDK